MTRSVGNLIVLSGPSGVGKSTILRSLIARFSDSLRLSISATTRKPRPGEQDGVDYYFLASEEFTRRREAGEFLECCEVFGRGHWYGTLRSEVAPRLAAGKWVVLEIDVDGALQGTTTKIRQRAAEAIVDPERIRDLIRGWWEPKHSRRATLKPHAPLRR